MEYLLMVYSDEQANTAMPAAQLQEMIGAYMAYTEALRAANVLRGSNRLRPTSAATVVRVANGERRIVDGPYAETKEQLGGYYLIDAPDLDAALDWAARCPAAKYGSVEVRPVWVM